MIIFVTAVKAIVATCLQRNLLTVHCQPYVFSNCTALAYRDWRRDRPYINLWQRNDTVQRFSSYATTVCQRVKKELFLQ